MGPPQPPRGPPEFFGGPRPPVPARQKIPGGPGGPGGLGGAHGPQIYTILYKNCYFYYIFTIFYYKTIIIFDIFQFFKCFKMMKYDRNHQKTREKR